MRTREEIEEDQFVLDALTIQDIRDKHQPRIIVELLLDIRDLLATKQDTDSVK